MMLGGTYEAGFCGERRNEKRAGITSGTALDSCLYSFLPCPPAPIAAKLGPVVQVRGELHLFSAFLSSGAEIADRPREGPSTPQTMGPEH